MARPNYSSNGISKEELPKKKLSKEGIKESLWIFKYVKPYKTKFILGLVVIALSSVTTMSFPFFLKELINSAYHQEHSTDLTGDQIALLMISILLIQVIFSFCRVYLFTTVGESALADLRKDIYKNLIVMPMDFFSQRRVGELSSRLSADVSQIQDTVTSVLAELLRGSLVLIIGIGMIVYLSFKLTLIMISVIPLIVVFAVIYSRKIRSQSKKTQDQLAESGTIVQETLQGISIVKSFSNEKFELRRYSNSIDKVVQLAIKNGEARGVFVSVLLFTMFSTIVLMVWYSTKGILNFGELTGFVIATAFVGGTMAGFADLYGQLQKTLGATQRVREILLEKTEDIDLTLTAVPDQNKLFGKVELKNIAFSYPSRPEIEVLKDISITAFPGQQVAIVGTSGAGKSTIASLLLKFYDPVRGSILFDNREGRSIPVSQLRKQMAFVPQDIILFGGTIFENISYGKADASREEVEEAAKKANAHDFVMSFPEGYETVVGERGIKLSGGQRQRIAIARAILKDPVILILDEATSSLDSASELLVQEALDNLMKNRTSFVIAHRLSTIRNADKIVVLDKGYVKEVGTHEELLTFEDGIYKNLNKLQVEWNS
jgi:ABC-type multidrug transport system fused ATPase/permease subunit